MCLTQCLAGSRWADEGRPFDCKESLKLVEAIVMKISAYRRHVYTDVLYIVLYFPIFQSVGVSNMFLVQAWLCVCLFCVR